MITWHRLILIGVALTTTKKAVKGIFGCLKRRRKRRNPADILAELKAELQAVQEMERETLDGAGVFSRQRGGKGDLVFIINLDPVYKLIGGKKGRLRKVCGK